MAAYLINHLRTTRNVPKLASRVYIKKVEATFKPYGGKWLVLDVQVEVPGGARSGSVAFMEFPDVETAKKWYYSPKYQDILHLGTNNAAGDLILVDPLAPDFTSASWAQQVRRVTTSKPSQKPVTA